MTIKEEILELLRKNVPIKEISKRYSSKSALYEAVGVRLIELEEQIGKEQRIIDKQNMQNSKLNDKIKKGKAENKKISVIRRELLDDVKDLSSRKDKLSSKVSELADKQSRIQRYIAECTAKGYTLEHFELLKLAFDRNANEVRALLELHNSYAMLNEKNNEEQKEEKKLKDSISNLQKTKTKTSKQLAKMRNELDFIEAEKFAWGEAGEVIKSALKRGYSKEELASIFAALQKVEITNKPGLSIRRLLEVFFDAKNVVSLKEQEQLLEKRVKELSRHHSEVLSQLEFRKIIVTRFYEELMEKGENTIGTAVTNWANTVNSAGKSTIKELLNLIEELNKKTKTAQDTIAFSNYENAKLETTKKYLHPLLYLMGDDSDPLAYKKVSDQQIVGLLNNIEIWLESKYPKSYTKVSINPTTKKLEESPYPAFELKISSLLDSVAEYIKKRASKDKTKKDN